LSIVNYQLSIKLGRASPSRARLYHFRALPQDYFNRFLIDFYPKDIKEIAAAGGSWGVLLLRKKSLKKMKIWGQSPEIREPLLAPKNLCHPRNLREITITSHQPPSTVNCQLSPSSPPPGSNLWKNIINEKLMVQLMVN